MISRRSFLIGWGSVGIALLSIGLAVWAFRQRQSLRAEVSELANSRSTMGMAIKRAQAMLDRKKVSELAAAKLKMQSDLSREQALFGRKRESDPNSKTSLKTHTKASLPVLPNGKPDSDAIISSNPALLATYESMLRIYFGQVSLFAQLNLSQGQLDDAENLIVNNREARMDLDAAAQSQGLTTDDPTVVQEREQQNADLQAAEQALLGPQAYDAFQAVYRAQMVLGDVQIVSQATEFSGAPLTAEQSNQLMQLMAQSSADYQNGKDATSTTIDWNAVLTGAPRFLNPTQIYALQGVVQSYQFGTLAKGFATQSSPGK